MFGRSLAASPTSLQEESLNERPSMPNGPEGRVILPMFRYETHSWVKFGLVLPKGSIIGGWGEGEG